MPEKTTAGSKRRRDSSENGSDSAKRPRGRPRVQKKDETAADRRRTQIRLAQRAYRSRKETTIASLKENALELEQIIQQMGAAFTQFKEAAVLSGIASLGSHLTENLRNTSAQMTKLSRRADEISAEQSELVEQAPKSKPSVPLDHSNEIARAAPTRLSPTQLSHTATLQDLSVQKYPTPSPSIHDIESFQSSLWGISATPEHDHSEAESDATTADHSGVVHSYSDIEDFPSLGLSQQQLSVVNGLFQSIDKSVISTKAPMSGPFDIFSTATEQPAPLSPPRELPSPFTYSFQEISFARRLHRASLESAFHAISNPNYIRPRRLAQAFRLTLLFHTKEQIADMISTILRRGTTESLDFEDSPFLHLGGAGTHYPRRDELGNIIPKKYSYNVETIGRHRIGFLNDPNKRTALATLDLSDEQFAGDWLDPEDVEGYLMQKKNIFIDPRDSFTEADMWDDDHTSQNQGQVLELNDNLPDVDASLGSLDSFASALTQEPVFANNFESLTPPHLALSPPRQRHVTIDVQKLIHNLMSHGMCLGRSPGYRLVDVDKALDRSIVTF